MAVTYPELGHKVKAKIISVQGDCTIGMKLGDEFDLSVHQCGEFCGVFYHNIYGWVTCLQTGGSVPFFEDPDVQMWVCPNPEHSVTIELRRLK